MVYHSKRLKLKSSKDRCFGDKIREILGTGFLQMFSQWSHTCLIFPATKCDSTCKVLSTREPPISVGVQVSYWGVTQACSTFVTDLSYSDASLPEQKVFTANHLSQHKLSDQTGVVWPRTWANKITLTSTIFQELTAHFLETGKKGQSERQSFLGNLQGLSSQIC